MNNNKDDRLSNWVNNILKIDYYATFGNTLLLALLWIIILGGWAVLRGSYLETNPPLFFDYITVTVSFFFLGCAGALSAFRKELHQIITIRGKVAKILSILWAIASWGVAGYSLIKGIAILI